MQAGLTVGHMSDFVSLDYLNKTLQVKMKNEELPRSTRKRRAAPQVPLAPVVVRPFAAILESRTARRLARLDLPLPGGSGNTGLAAMHREVAALYIPQQQFVYIRARSRG